MNGKIQSPHQGPRANLKVDCHLTSKKGCLIVSRTRSSQKTNIWTVYLSEMTPQVRRDTSTKRLHRLIQVPTTVSRIGPVQTLPICIHHLQDALQEIANHWPCRRTDQCSTQKKSVLVHNNHGIGNKRQNYFHDAHYRQQYLRIQTEMTPCKKWREIY